MDRIWLWPLVGILWVVSVIVAPVEWVAWRLAGRPNGKPWSKLPDYDDERQSSLYK